MLFTRSLLLSTLVSFLLVGCSSTSDAELTAKNESSTSLSVESIQKDASVVKSEDDLVKTLTPLARTLDENAFIEESINTLIPSLVASYVPEGYEEEVLAQDELQTEALKSNTFFTDKIREFYLLANKNQRASALDELSTVVSDISSMVYDFIYSYFFSSGSDDANESSLLDDALDWVWGSDSDEESADTNITDPTGNGGELVSESLGFNYEMLKNRTFYVVSSKADMTVNMSSDGKSGSGSMGFISMDFTDKIVDDNIEIATSLMGDWTIKMTYLDSDYCIAADTIDAEGTLYKSYWFTNSADKETAKTVSQAQSLCYQHGWVGGAPTENSVDESDVVYIEDARDGFEIKTGESTKEIVTKLINEPSKSANVEDAKYFTRSLRHGALSLYTTNDKPDTLEALETEVMSRTLAPLAGSSLLQMKDLAVEAMDTTKVFSSEMQEDLNASITHISNRLNALATTASTAMDNTIEDDDYHGVATSSYGDRVDIWITDMDTNICLVFFLCESSVDATVHFSISNNGVDGNFADVQFVTRVNAESININAINFSKVLSEQSVNRFGAEGYELDFDNFEFNRNASTLHVAGEGELKQITQNSAKTVATFSEFDILLQLARQSVDITDYALVSANLSMSGSVETKSGRAFNGSLRFDAKNSASNKIDGTIVGINDEPTVSGVIKTSLTYKDIDTGINGREQISVMSRMPYLVDANGNIELVASFYELFGKKELENFKRDKYECSKATSSTYTCKKKYSFNDNEEKTLKFTQEGDIITIGTTQGDYYIVDIQNVGSQSPSTMVLLHVDNSTHETINAFDYDKAQVNNIRVTTHSLDDEVSINNIGDHSYSMNMNVKKDNQLLNAYMLVSRDTKADTWDYLLSDVKMQNEYGELNIDEFYVKEEGSLRFEDELYNLILGNVIGEYSLDTESLFGLTWGDFENVKAFRISSLMMKMHTNGSSDAEVAMNADITRTSSDIVGTFNAAYAYDETNVTQESDFSVGVSGSGESAIFTPTIKASGTITSLDTADFSYAIDVEDDTKYLLLNNDETSYQQGFIVNNTSINVADSYGVKANITSSEDNRVLKKMRVSNKASTILGTYDKSIDAQKITYSDGVSEYLYIH